MSDIFISYAREDRDKAKALAGLFQQQDWSVWWDRNIPPGRSFDEVIEEALGAAKCVVVLWSKNSASSDWVKGEAAEALQRKILVPVRIDSANVPLEFRRLQTVDLSDWRGDAGHPELGGFLEAVAANIKGVVQRRVSEGGQRKLMRSTLVITLLVAAGLITAKILLEDKLRYFEDKAYELIQWRLISRGTTTRPDILVIDTAQVPRQPFRSGLFTSRVKLREVIKSLTDLQARSIGIDVDFSPENGQFIDADDPNFFQFCLDHSSATHVPIFLGVYRTDIESAPSWLGDDRFLHLAAFIGIKKTDRAVYWKMSGGTDFPLRGLGAAMAGKRLKEMVAEENSLLSLFIRQTSIIQFRWLQRIREDVFHSINPEYLHAEREKITGRMILLGDANEDSCGSDPALWKYRDCFSVISIHHPVKGVFLHACAASTIANNEPLFEFTPTGRICADVILALLTIGAVALVCALREREEPNSRYPEWKLNMMFTFMMILVVLLVSIGLVGFIRLLWVDFILGCVVMLLQLIVDTRSEWSKHLLPRRNQRKNPSPN
jgi:CHASE2 domain-containing sensor protein